jgi:hypothetical protein
MSSIKCKNCGLANFPHEDACRRCRGSLIRQNNKTKTRTPRRFSLSGLVIVAFVAGFAYYAYYGLQKEADEIYANEMKRLEQQKTDKTAGLSRSEYEKHRTGAYGTAIQNSNSFAAHGQHIKDTEKLMQTTANARQGTQ